MLIYEIGSNKHRRVRNAYIPQKKLSNYHNEGDDAVL